MNGGETRCSPGVFTNSSAKRPIGARTVQRLRSDVDLRRLVRGFSSQLRNGRFHGHCTSASAMKQRTWTRAIKKHTQEAENKGRPATRLALLLLPDADVGRQPQKIHRALWTFTGSGKAVSMHCRACRGEMRWRQGRRTEHRRGLPVLQHNAAQGEASRGRRQTRFRRPFQAGKGQVAPAAGQGRFQPKNRATGLSRTGSTIIPTAR